MISHSKAVAVSENLDYSLVFAKIDPSPASDPYISVAALFQAIDKRLCGVAMIGCACFGYNKVTCGCIRRSIRFSRRYEGVFVRTNVDLDRRDFMPPPRGACAIPGSMPVSETSLQLRHFRFIMSACRMRSLRDKRVSIHS